MTEIVEHRDAWAAEFLLEADRLRQALGELVVEIEHIGSTAVPGLVAKPVIDIAARAGAGRDPSSMASAIGALGYSRSESGPKDHGVYIRTGARGERTHILHVFGFDRWIDCNQRLFRDVLLDDAGARDRYARLKRRLIAEGLHGRAYTRAKLELVEELVNAERLARGLGPVPVWDK